MGWIEKNVGNKNGVGTGGVGFVVVPTNVSDLGLYIQQCYRSNEVTLSGDGYGVMSHVKVADGVMDRIKFPNNDKGKGSLVVWVRESFYNRPIVVGVISDSNTPSEQSIGQSSQKQEYQGITAEVLTDALNSLLQMYACGNNIKPARVIVKAAGSDKDDVEIQASNKIKTISKSLSLDVTDEFDISVNDAEKEIIKIEGDVDKLHFKDYNENELTISNLEDDEHEKYIELKDTFGRSYLFDKDKAEIKDQFGNTFVFDKDKTELQDQFGNDFLFDNDKIELNDKFGNKIVFDKSSCEFKDQFGHTVSFSSGNFKCKDSGTNELNFTGAGAQIKTMRFRVGNGLHPMVLGTPLVTILTKLCAEIQKITVDTPSGISSPPLNAQAFSEISASLATALSLISSTD